MQQIQWPKNRYSQLASFSSVSTSKARSCIAYKGSKLRNCFQAKLSENNWSYHNYSQLYIFDSVMSAWISVHGVGIIIASYLVSWVMHPIAIAICSQLNANIYSYSQYVYIHIASVCYFGFWHTSVSKQWLLLHIKSHEIYLKYFQIHVLQQ